MARGRNDVVIVYILHRGKAIESVWGNPNDAIDAMWKIGPPEWPSIAVRPLNSLEDSEEVKAARERLHELMGHARIVRRN